MLHIIKLSVVAAFVIASLINGPTAAASKPAPCQQASDVQAR